MSTNNMTNLYDYKSLEERFRLKLSSLEGRVVNSIKAQLVQTDINQLFLDTDNGYIAIIPSIGGEVLDLAECDKPKSSNELQLFDVLRNFWGQRIVQARMIGEAWNGHGVEIGFDGMPTQTILISSVECSENNIEISDALRIGMGSYEIEIQSDT